jgi:hypothetical protein
LIYVWQVRRAAAIVIATLAAVGASVSTAADTPTQVTVIGDSVLTAVLWNSAPLAILQQGLQMQLDIGICRRLNGVSCPFEGAETPTLADVVEALGPRLGKVVVIEVGYNDGARTFPDAVEQSVRALLQAGVSKILWLNLHGSGAYWDAKNAVLVAAARRHPEVSIVDWNGYARDHWSWFQGDSVHLTYDGALAIATLLHGAIVEAVTPLAVATATLPVAQVGRLYAAQLRAEGGIGSYEWRVLRQKLPSGLRLLADGRLYGIPQRSGSIEIAFSVTDSFGFTSTATTTLRILAARA